MVADVEIQAESVVVERDRPIEIRHGEHHSHEAVVLVALAGKR